MGNIATNRYSGKLSHKLILLMSVSLVGFITLAGYSVHMIRDTAAKIRAAESKARVNGDIYNSIIQGKDVLADVLPPPIYILEPFLVAYQLTDATDSAQTRKLMEKMSQLRKDYEDRHAFWEKTITNVALKNTLTTEAHEPAMRFFETLDKEFMPAIAKGDKPVAQEILRTKLISEYANQRTIVDKVVSLAAGNNAAKESELKEVLSASGNEVNSVIGAATVSTCIGVIVLALISAVIGVFVSRSITKPVTAAVTDLTRASDQISASAGQVSSASQVLAEGASTQASSLEETSASMEELTSMTKQNADNASEADTLMRQSLSIINNTSGAMGAMDTSMNEIASSSEQTSKIIKTIDEIAFQTNLLALNAAVEAARAGEAGAGFAVVADEVRNLAMRATEAAKNTAGLIEDTVLKVKTGKEIVNKVTEAFREVSESSTKVASLVGEISAASREQAQGIGQINQAITEMDTVTQQNAASAEESAAAVTELNVQAQAMIGTVIKLKSLVDGQAMGITHKPSISRSAPTPKSLTIKRQPPQKVENKTFPATPHKVASSTPSKATAPESVIPMEDEPSFADF